MDAPSFETTMGCNFEDGVGASSVLETVADIALLGLSAAVLLNTADSIRNTRRKIKETDRFIEESERQLAEMDQYIDDLKQRRLAREMNETAAADIIEVDYTRI